MSRLNNPTLLLHGIDVDEVIDEYLRGDYDNLSLNDLPKFTGSNLLIKLIREDLPTDFNEVKFVIRDPHNNRIIIQTTGKNDITPIHCAYHGGLLGEDNVGIGVPTSYRVWFSKNTNAYIHEFRAERTCCSWSCMLALMYESNRYNEDNERFARWLWKLAHPSQLIPEPATDRDMVDINQGSATEAEFKDTSLINIPVKLIICAEARHIAQLIR